MNWKKNLLQLTVASSISLLAACGGGGIDSSGDNGGGVVTSSNTHLDGVVNKGVITNGIVKAYELDADGNRTLVGSAVTNSKGEYSLDLNGSYQGGVVEIEVSAGADTKMTCDVAAGCAGIQFGQTIALKSTFNLKALVQPDGKKITVPVTPLTHMAAALALKAGNLSKAAVDDANSKVSNMVGFDIINTPVADVTSTTDVASKGKKATVYGLYNAGVGASIMSGSQGIEEGLSKLARSFEDGTFSQDDGITINDILSAVEDNTNKVVSDLGDAADSTFKDAVSQVNTQVAQTSAQVKGGSFTPKPEEKPTALNQTTAISAAKALIQDARTVFIQADDISKRNSIAPEFDAQVQAVKDVFDKDNAIAIQLLTTVLDQVMADLNSKTDLSKELASPKSYSTEIKDSAGTEVGALTSVFSVDNGISITINGTLSGSEGSATIEDLKLSTNLTKANISATSNAVTRIAAQSVELKLSGTVTAGESSIQIAEAKPVSLSLELYQFTTFSAIDSATATDNKTALKSHFKRASLSGDVVVTNSKNNASFTGQIRVGLARLADAPSARTPISLNLLKVKGEFVSDKGRLSAGATLRIDNATAFDTFGPFLNPKSMFISGVLGGDAIDIEKVDSAASTIKSLDTKVNYMAWEAVSYEGLSSTYYYPKIKLYYLQDSIRGYVERSGDVLGWNKKFEDVSSGIEMYGPFDSSLKNLSSSETLLFDKSYSAYVVDASQSNPLYGNVTATILSANTPGLTSETVFGSINKDVDGDKQNESVSVVFNRDKDSLKVNDGQLQVSGYSFDPLGHNLDAFIPSGSTPFNYIFDGENAKIDYKFHINEKDYKDCELDPFGFFAAKSIKLNDWEKNHVSLCLVKLTWSGGDSKSSMKMDAFNHAVIEPEVEKNLIKELKFFGGKLTGKIENNYYFIRGGFSQENTPIFYSGVYLSRISLDSQEKVDNFVKGQLTVTANISLPELPDALATVSVDRSSYQGGSLLALVTVKDKTFKIEADSTDVVTDEANGHITISNVAGIKFVMKYVDKDRGVTGDVFYNSNGTDIDIGDISMVDKIVKVTYVDGTFDSIQ